MSRLDGKIALITGGTTGIGLATAKRFHKEGARVFVTGRNAQTLEAARKELPKEVTVLQADSGKLADLDKLVAEIKAQAGRLDVLFVNAGIAPFLPLENADEAHWDQIMDINLKGPFFLTQKALPLLSRGSSVIFTTSVVGRKGFPGSGVYSASKAGLAGLARVLSMELAPKGIRVNSLAPGPVATPIFSRTGLSEAEIQGMREHLASRVPMQRMGADDEIAHAAVFLASDESSFVTGDEMLVDGGVAIA